MIKLPSIESINSIIQETIYDVYAEEAINEVKQYDKAHGKKLPHKVLDDFFKQKAPNLKSLTAVKSALTALYKQNGVELENNGINQIITTYKKKLNGVKESLEEVALTSDEKKQKDKLVILLKKNSKEYRMRYKDKEVADMQNLATALVKK